MSYSLMDHCGDCKKKSVCTDRHVIYGAIRGIHQMPTGTGHLGYGTIDLNCYGWEDVNDNPAESEGV